MEVSNSTYSKWWTVKVDQLFNFDRLPFWKDLTLHSCKFSPWFFILPCRFKKLAVTDWPAHFLTDIRYKTVSDVSPL